MKKERFFFLHQNPVNPFICLHMVRLSDNIFRDSAMRQVHEFLLGFIEDKDCHSDRVREAGNDLEYQPDQCLHAQAFVSGLGDFVQRGYLFVSPSDHLLLFLATRHVARQPEEGLCVSILVPEYDAALFYVQDFSRSRNDAQREVGHPVLFQNHFPEPVCGPLEIFGVKNIRYVDISDHFVIVFEGFHGAFVCVGDDPRLEVERVADVGGFPEDAPIFFFRQPERLFHALAAGDVPHHVQDRLLGARPVDGVGVAFTPPDLSVLADEAKLNSVCGLPAYHTL